MSREFTRPFTHSNRVIMAERVGGAKHLSRAPVQCLNRELHEVGGVAMSSFLTLLTTTFLSSAILYSQVGTAPVTSSLKRLIVSPSALTFYGAANTASTFEKQGVTVTSGDGTPIGFTVTASSGNNWLSVITTNLTDGGTTPLDLLVKVATSSLPVGTYSGTVTVTAVTPGVLNSPVVIPVTLIMTPQNTLVLSNASILFTQSANGIKLPPQSISVIGTSDAGTPIAFATVVSYGVGQGWLTVSQSTATTPSTLTITANAAGLAAGTHTAQILLVSAGVISQTVNIILTVGASGGGFAFAGSLAHFAAGGNWITRITLVNNGTAAAQAHLDFFDDNGNAVALPLVFVQTSLAVLPPATTVDRTLAPGAALTIQTAGPDDQPTQSGWIQLLSGGNIGGFAVFQQFQDSGEPEAVVPLETRNAGSYVLYFDQTSGSDTGLALANIAVQLADIPVIIRDDAGSLMQSSDISLGAQGHTAFVLADRFPATVQRRGTIEFDTPPGGQINILGLNFSPGLAFSTIPPLAK